MATNPHNIDAVDIFRPMRLQVEVPAQINVVRGGSRVSIVAVKDVIVRGFAGEGGGDGCDVFLEFGTLRVTGPAKSTIARFGVAESATIDVSGELQVLPGPNTVNVVNGVLSLGGTPQNPAGQLDLTNTRLELSGFPLEVLLPYIESGYDGGTWMGRGLVSSNGRTDRTVGLGYGPLDGQPRGGPVGGGVPGDAWVVRLTKFGDADLNGLVAFPDLVALAQNYNTIDGSAFWFRGDFNYDGNVTFTDLVMLAQNYGSSFAAPIPGAPAEFYSDWAAAVASVPEPAGGVVVLGLLARLRRRRR
jgi:hypothetical protein